MIEEIRTEELDEQTTAVVRGVLAPADIPAFTGEAFAEVGAALAAQGVFPTGPPFSRYSMGDGVFAVATGFPCSGSVEPAGRVEPMRLPAGTVATTVHVGPWDQLGEAYEAVGAWMTEHGWVPTGDPWEAYLDGPEVVEHRTLLRFPCRKAD